MKKKKQVIEVDDGGPETPLMVSKKYCDFCLSCKQDCKQASFCIVVQCKKYDPINPRKFGRPKKEDTNGTVQSNRIKRV